MLNGKFYTGLPPKMVERQGVKVCNRQESHFFWPDDSRADSAVENRVKRRNSQQLERPPVERITSIQDAPSEVDTRRMFHKEFASSSIQFYDNLQSNQGKKPVGRGQRREITPKLTEVRPQELVSKSEDFTNRRQQAYSSKIQFYDYVNEADNVTQNNARRPQMDFNDKREVELNSKNSPKLQVKRNVRSFSVELEEPKVTKKPLNDSPEWRRPRPLPPQSQPKRILKQTEQDPYEYLENRVRRLQLTRSPGLPKKHVTYNEEAAEYAYYDDRGDREDREEPTYESRPRQQPNMPTGSRQQQQQHHNQQQNQRSFMETSRAKPLNNNNNYLASPNARKILPKLPELQNSRGGVPVHLVEDEEPPLPSDPRKHLRSSLCFSGDALMVGGATDKTTAQARRSSAGQRISVGLPD